jgi:hypothetical protein
MRRRFVVALFATALAVVLWTPVASAAPVTKTLNFPLKGSSHTSLYHQGFTCCHIHFSVDPFGTFDGDIHGSVDLSVDNSMNVPTQNTLNYTDTNLRQGRHLDLTNTFTASPSTLDINYSAGVDLNIYGLDFNPTASESDSLSCGLPLTSNSCAHTKNIPIASFTVLDVGVASFKVNVFAAITTTAHLNGDGVTTLRTLSVAGAPALGPDSLNFSSSPQTKNEGVDLSCTLPKNEPVNYAMGDEASHVSGTLDEGLGIGVGGEVDAPIVGDIFDVGPFDFGPFFTLTGIGFNPITLTSPGQNVDLGNLQPNNIPPKISTATVGGTMVEGQDVSLTAALSSPCGPDSLHTEWKFSNPNSTEKMVAYGASSHIVFPDNGNWTGTLTVSDPTGLSTTKDLAPFVITNAAPTLSAVADRHAEWGDVVKYHVDAFDSSADQGSLAFAWNFGDGGSANGQSVEHVFSTPSSPTGYAGVVTATDKDGGVGTGGFHTIVDKRPSTLVYTGAVSALTKTSPILSATLADDHGQPVNGGQVTFTLGAQSTSSNVDSTGHTSTTFVLNQAGDVAPYAFSAVYGGNAFYTASTASLPSTFRIDRRATSVTYTGDLDQRPNHVALLTARVVDELGQPVVGAPVVFTLGSQTMTGTTDSTGLATVGMTLTQGPGAYVLKAVYAGDPTYRPGSAGAMVFSIPKNNGAVAGTTIAAARPTLATKSLGKRPSLQHARKARAARRHARLIAQRTRGN